MTDDMFRGAIASVGQIPENDLELTCPRCDQARTERFYGPCEPCRAELRATQAGTSSEVAAAEYEPKMNVVPNAIASKE